MNILQAEFPIFAELVVMAGQADLLRSTGPFTVFAPTDEAFASLPEGALDMLKADELLLSQYINSQIAPDIWPTRELIKGDRRCDFLSGLETLNEMSFYGTNDYGQILVGNAAIVVGNLEVRNGLVHGMDYVDVDSRDPIWSEVTRAVWFWEGVERMQRYLVDVGGPYDMFCGNPELLELLDGDGPFTFFVPTDEAFTQLEAKLGSELTYYDVVGEIVRYLIIEGEMLTPQTETQDSFVTYQESEMQVAFSNEQVVQINGIEINILAQMRMRNGVVYMIDAVPVPPDLDLENLLPTIWEIVANSEQLTIFAESVESAFLEEQFSQWGLLTLFAPSDDVLTAMSPEELDAWMGQDFYLIYFNRQLLSNLEISELVRTDFGYEIPVSFDGEQLYLGEARVIEVIEAQNGIVYILDAFVGVEVE